MTEQIRPVLRLAPFAILALALVFAVGCQPAEEGTGAEAEDTAPPPMAEEPEAAAEVTLEPMSDSPEFPDATLTLVEPAGNELEAGNQSFRFEVSNYELGAQTADAETKGIANSADGQHIHFILDNGAYAALYEPSHTAELTEGSHVLLAFLSRSYHESVKSPGAFLVKELLVGGAEPSVDLEAPHLFYSRPKGSYSGEGAEAIMLDFFLVNADLSADGYRVRVTVEGQTFTVDEWQPYVLRGLPDGEVEIGLELIDADGEVVPGPFNSVTRTITVDSGTPGA